MRRLIARCLFAGTASILALACSTGSAIAQPNTLPPDARIATGTSDAPAWQRDGSDGGHFVGGLGVIAVKPYFESNRAFSRTTVPAVGPPTSNSTDFSYSPSVSPRVWLGYVSKSGWGIRANAWYFDQSNSTSGSLGQADFVAGGSLTSSAPASVSIFTPTLPLLFGIGTGTDILTATTRLRMSVADIEATKSFDVGRGTILLSGGARLARIEQFYNATIFNTANDPAVISQTFNLTSVQRFTGAGPTIAFQGEFPLGSSHFGVYSTIRGALLAGWHESSADSSMTTTIAGFGATVPLASNTLSRESVVPMGSIELGVEWKRCWGRSQPLIRFGAFAESYGSVLSNNNPGLPNPISPSGNLTFFGFTAAVGLRY